MLARAVGRLGVTARWRSRGRRLCPRRRPWASAAIAEASAELDSLAAIYDRLDGVQHQHEVELRSACCRRRRDFEVGLYSLDGHLAADAAFRAFVAERTGLRLPTPEEAAASWLELEVA